jgi:hypothetical protein
MAHDHEIYMTLADAAAESRDTAALRKYAPQLEKLASRDGHGHYLAVAHRALGIGHRLSREYTQAETRFRQALELFTKSGARWQIGRTLFELGELNLEQPANKAKAREFLAQALGSFEEIRATPSANRTRAALNALE